MIRNTQWSKQRKKGPEDNFSWYPLCYQENNHTWYPLSYLYVAVVVVVQSLSHVRLFVAPWTAAYQASLSFTISCSLLRLMSFESMMPSNHLILCQFFISPLILNDNLAEYSVLGFRLFRFSHCKYFMPLPPGLQSFSRKINRYLYGGSLVYDSFCKISLLLEIFLSLPC